MIEMAEVCSYCGEKGHSIQQCPKWKGREVATATQQAKPMQHRLFYTIWTLGRRIGGLEVTIERRGEIQDFILNLATDLEVIARYGYEVYHIEAKRKELEEASKIKDWVMVEARFHELQGMVENFVAHALAGMPI